MEEVLYAVSRTIAGDGIEQISICSETGLLPRVGCPVTEEYFDIGTMPTDYCDQHFYEYTEDEENTDENIDEDGQMEIYDDTTQNPDDPGNTDNTETPDTPEDPGAGQDPGTGENPGASEDPGDGGVDESGDIVYYN